MRMCDWQYGKPTLILLVLLVGQLEEAGGQSSTACQALVKKIEVSERTWWRYYERGMVYAKHECWREAVQDFQTAIRRQPQDKPRARTQGLKFIPYFPRRELGIVYYHLGRYTEAISELQLSLQHTAKQNEKAREYLSRAQQSLAKHPASSNNNMAPCDVPPKPLVDFNWWNYYQRGRAYAEDKCWLEAAQDFRAAIAERPQDAHRARTFGLRFVDYFPHRELGIVYYHLGLYPEAVRELETSLEHVDREKNQRAREFLSRALDAS